jgi:hypothetical protein
VNHTVGRSMTSCPYRKFDRAEKACAAPLWYAEIPSATHAVQKTRFLPREFLFLAAALFLIPIP